MALRAFFDGDGKAELDPVLMVGGYFAEEGVCAAIEKDWLTATVSGPPDGTLGVHPKV